MEQARYIVDFMLANNLIFKIKTEMRAGTAGYSQNRSRHCLYPCTFGFATASILRYPSNIRNENEEVDATLVGYHQRRQQRV